MENTNILSQFDIQAAMQAIRDATSNKMRHIFILQEMIAVISYDSKQIDYANDANQDAEIINEVSTLLDSALEIINTTENPFSHETGVVNSLAKIKLRIREGVNHSFRPYITELRRESLTLSKLYGLIGVLVE